MLQPTRKYYEMDMISKLPPGIIETILCLLPIQEAARTSILCKEWRYHWTKIPKLAFIEKTFQVSTYGDELSVLEQTFDRPNQRREMTIWCKIFSAIYQVLLMHKGPILEFTFSMYADNSCVEVDHILNNLSQKNTVKNLTLDPFGRYKPPLSLFSFHQLTNLYFNCCVFDYQPTFNGFGSLTSLHLDELMTSKKMLLLLLSKCPSLKSVTLKFNGATIECSDDHSTIVNFFECLPVVEDLSIWFHIIFCFVPYEHPEELPKELPTALRDLKYLCMESVCFVHKFGIPFLAFLIRSSPNLEKLKLEILDDSGEDDFEICSFTLEDYYDIRLEHLMEFEILHFSDGEYELDFVKLILANSPVLKKVSVFLDKIVDKDEEWEILEDLVRSPRASPVVDVIVRQMETSSRYVFSEC